MTSQLPTGIHSIFKERVIISVRAPEGSSARAVLMRQLVEEMTERKATGHLNDWMVEALLDRLANDMARGGHGGPKPVQIERRPEAASQPVEGNSAEQVHTTVVPIPQAAVEQGGGQRSDDRKDEPVVLVSHPLPSGLRAM